MKKGPAVANAMKDGAPTKALEGFARGAGAKIEDLTIVHDDKQDVYAYEYVQPANRWANFWKTLSIKQLRNCRFRK